MTSNPPPPPVAPPPPRPPRVKKHATFPLIVIDVVPKPPVVTQSFVDAEGEGRVWLESTERVKGYRLDS